MSEIDGLTVEPVETNLVFFDVGGLGISAYEFNQALMKRGMRTSINGPTRLRAVTHLDVSSTQIEEALDIIKEVAEGVHL